jgi:hypothetical protein
MRDEKMKMKNLKRIMILLMATTMIFNLAACGKKNNDDQKNSEMSGGSLGSEVDDIEVNTDSEVVLANGEQILIDVYSSSAIEFPVMTWTIDVNDSELVKSYAGLENGDKLAALAVSEPAMAEIAYSAVFVELKDAKDAEDVAKAMREGVNPKKWEGVEADDIDVVIEGKYICLVMISSEFKETTTAKDLTTLVVDAIKVKHADTNTESATEENDTSNAE